jgi:hypothetical protein
MKDKIIIYQADEASTQLEVRVDDETVWLTQSQMADLFQTTSQNITTHIKNIFKEGELTKTVTCKDFLQVQEEGGRIVKRRVGMYSLDVIISVGYRVKSLRGTQFRIWANRVLKEYLLNGHVLSNRIEKLENEMHGVKCSLEDINLQIKSSLPVKEGVFYEGQTYDAYVFVSKIIKSAQNSVLLIDNYVDESVLLILSKRMDGVTATIYTASLTNQLKLDLKKCCTQYPDIDIKLFDKSHDRFLIIDKKILYHIGASLKDLGKKWFAFSRIDALTPEVLRKLNE